jgi:hypothetical protein
MHRFPSHALLAGAVAAVLFVLAVSSVIGPTASDGPGAIAAKLADGREFALLALFGAGIGAMFAAWFAVIFRGWLRQAIPDSTGDLGSVALVGATLAIGIGLVGLSLFYGATYKLSTQGGSGAVLGLADAASAVMMMTKFPSALFLVAVSVAGSQSGCFPRWFNRLGWVSAVVLIGSSVGLFTHDSFTQFGGPLDIYGVLPGSLWGILLGVLLYRHQPSIRQPR